MACYISSTLLLTLPVKRRQEEEIVRNETDKEGENKNNDNKRKHQLESKNIILSAGQGKVTV